MCSNLYGSQTEGHSRVGWTTDFNINAFPFVLHELRFKTFLVTVCACFYWPGIFISYWLVVEVEQNLLNTYNWVWQVGFHLAILSTHNGVLFQIYPISEKGDCPEMSGLKNEARNRAITKWSLTHHNWDVQWLCQHVPLVFHHQSQPGMWTVLWTVRKVFVQVHLPDLLLKSHKLSSWQV